MLNDATVNWSGRGSGTGVAAAGPDATSGGAGSGRIVHVRYAKSMTPVTFASVWPLATSSGPAPRCASLSIRSRSGLPSNRVTQHAGVGGTGSSRSMPASRIGRATPVTTA